MATLPEPTGAEVSSRDFTLIQQSLDIELDFPGKSIRGTTELHITPLSGDLQRVGLHCRQCKITSVSVEGRSAKYEYRDPYRHLKPQPTWTIQQHHQLKDRFAPQLTDPPREELVVNLPKNAVVQENDPQAAAQSFSSSGRGNTRGQGSMSAPPETPTLSGAELHASYATLVIRVSFETSDIRTGLQFVGLSSSDCRYPHAFTTNSSSSGTACCLFPCIDDPSVRCSWIITIKCPATLRDALRPKSGIDRVQIQVEPGAVDDDDAVLINASGLSDEELSLEMHTVCSGHPTDEAVDASDSTRKVFSFACDISVSANQIGFAVGPFEKIDLAEFREIDGVDKSEDDAVAVTALCLPRRSQETRNTTMPLARAADYFKTTFTRNPFANYQMCFVDDLPDDTVVTAGLSLCSTRLLFPEDIIDSIYEVTRKLVYGLASQYAGIVVAGRELVDNWCIAGMAYFMTDFFMKHLCGNNEYRFRQKMASDRVCELDHDRPSLHVLGSILSLDASERDFLALKSGAVLFILDRRLAKSTSATAGMVKIIMRIVVNARSAFDGEGTLLSTSQFQRQCEKIGHCKLESFFQQWVYGAGCPLFSITQRFNKKKLVVEMQIKQTQADSEHQLQSQDLSADYFVRDVNEDSGEVWAAGIQPAFTGPMTIRIHEADGTPYEHIVEIKEGNTRIEIPYNTKYKRLKRSKRQKERIVANAGTEAAAENRDEALLYCLGDVLSTEDDNRQWRFADWSTEDEAKMGQESYEWIRMDADFEWICKMHITMPAYMYVSQLQQDRDVVAQHESLQWIAAQRPHPLIATFLTRTVMDQRYFHGIRTEATEMLTRCARDELGWIGLFHLEKMFQELFCVPNSAMSRPNDFTDRASYLVQCAIPRAMSKIRNNAGIAPMSVKRFLLDKVKFNDNSNNEFSDCYYIANLISCLADIMTISTDYGHITLSEDDEAEEDQFRKEAISEIERYRRIDEWLSSYHNIFSTTALDCLKRLAKSNVLQPSQADFLQYTRLGNADELRLAAFRCLGEMGALRNGSVLKYCFHAAMNDPSAYMREQIFNVLGRGLGLIALGEDKPEVKKQDVSGLIVEEGTTDARQAEVARKQTISGAVTALRSILGSSKTFTDGLWASLWSPVASLADVWRVLGICELIVEPEDSYIIKLKLPRYWSVKNEGEGKMHFVQNGRVRQHPRGAFSRPPRPPVPARQPTIKIPPPVRKPSISFKFNSQGQNTPTAATPVPRTPPVVVGSPAPTNGGSRIVFGPKTKGAAPKSRPTPSPAPSQVPSARQSPVLDRKSMPPPRNQLIVVLKTPKLSDPAFQEMLAQLPTRQAPASRRGSKAGTGSSRPSSSSSANSRTLNFGTLTNGHVRPSPSPALKQEAGSPDPLYIAVPGQTSPQPQIAISRRRGSSAVSVSSTASRQSTSKIAGSKRKASDTPTPGVEANLANGAKRRKSTPRRSSTPKSTAEAPPLPATNGLSDGKVNLSAPPKSNKRKSDATDHVNGVVKQPPTKKQKNDTEPRKSLMIKLNIGKENAIKALTKELSRFAGGINDKKDAVKEEPVENAES